HSVRTSRRGTRSQDGFVKGSSSNPRMQSIYTRPLSRLNALSRRRTKNLSLTTCERFLPGGALISLSQWAHPLRGFFCGIENGSYRRRHCSLPELTNARSGTFLGVLMTPLWGACSI